MTVGFLDRATPENFELYAAKHYDNPQCSTMEEFKEDLNRIKYVRKLLIKYGETGVLNHRLLLNHIIVLHNVFPVRIANELLFGRISKEFWPVLKTAFIFMGYIRNDDIIDVPLDNELIVKLRRI